jgi:hypothetical protein
VLAFANEFGMLGVPVLRQIWAEVPVAVPGSADGRFSVKHLAAGMPGRVAESLHSDGAGWSWAQQIQQLGDFIRLGELIRKKPKLVGLAPVATLNWAVRMTAHPFFRWSDTDRRLHYCLTPSSLIGAIWLQAGFSIADRKDFRACVRCDTPMEISRSWGARTDAIFCSDRCKSRDYRYRKNEAIRLGRKGMSVEQIAKKIATNKATVRRWLRERKD